MPDKMIRGACNWRAVGRVRGTRLGEGVGGSGVDERGLRGTWSGGESTGGIRGGNGKDGRRDCRGGGGTGTASRRGKMIGGRRRTGTGGESSIRRGGNEMDRGEEKEGSV